MIPFITVLIAAAAPDAYEQVRPLPAGETIYVRHAVVSPTELLVTSKAFATREPTFRLYRVRLATPPTDEQLGDFEHDFTLIGDPLHEGEVAAVEKIVEGKYQLWRTAGGALQKLATTPNAPASISCVKETCVAATSQAVLLFTGDVTKKLAGPMSERKDGREAEEDEAVEQKRTASLSPDGRFVAIADGTPSLLLIDAKRGSARAVGIGVNLALKSPDTARKQAAGCELQLLAWTTVNGKLRLEARQPRPDPLQDADDLPPPGADCGSKVFAFDAATGTLAETRAAAPPRPVKRGLKPATTVDLADGWQIFTRDHALLLGRRIPRDGGAPGEVGSAEHVIPARLRTVLEVSAKGLPQLDRFLQGRKTQLQFCYERALMRQPDLEVAQRVGFFLTPDGRARDVEAPDAGAEDLTDCVKLMARSWRFPFKPDADTRVELVLRFSHPK